MTRRNLLHTALAMPVGASFACCGTGAGSSGIHQLNEPNKPRFGCKFGDLAAV